MSKTSKEAGEAERLHGELWGSFLRDNKALFVGNVALSVPRALLNLLGSYAIGYAIDVVSGQGGPSSLGSWPWRPSWWSWSSAST